MAKALGIVLVLIGIVILALSIKPINEGVVKSFPQLEQIPNLYLIIAGAVVVVVGLLLMRGSSRRSKGLGEFPIYEGSQLVGFRRAR